MKIYTIENLGNTEYDLLGMVQGSTVQSKNVGKDIAASFKGMVGGELKGYTEMLQDAREVALERMISDAESKGANAIIGVRFSSSAITQGAAEIIVYGTAVKIK